MCMYKLDSNHSVLSWHFEECVASLAPWFYKILVMYRTKVIGWPWIWLMHNVLQMPSHL